MAPDPQDDPTEAEPVAPPPIDVAPSATGLVPEGAEDEIVEAPSAPDEPT